MLLHQFAVDPHFRLAHNGLEMQEHLLAFPGILGREMLAIPHLALIVHATACLRRQQFHSIGQRHQCPFAVIKIHTLGTGNCTFVETPRGIHTVSLTPGMGQLEKAGRGELRLMGRPQRKRAKRPKEKQHQFPNRNRLYHMFLFHDLSDVFGNDHSRNTISFSREADSLPCFLSESEPVTATVRLSGSRPLPASPE